MNSVRRDPTWGTRRIPTAVTAAAAIAALAGGGAAAAAVQPAVHPAAAAGVISTVAGGTGGTGPATQISLDGGAGTGSVGGVAYGAGRLYIADGGYVRSVSPSTDYLATAAGQGTKNPATGDGGPAAQARLVSASNVTVTSGGNLLVSDTDGYRVRMVPTTSGTYFGQVMTAGDIYTVAGDGKNSQDGEVGDNGPATQAQLNFATGIATDAHGNLVIADTSDQTIRVVVATAGTFYGKSMKQGYIYRVAGGGNGQGGTATSARLDNPEGVAVDAHGNLVIADTGDNTIQVVAASKGTFYGQKMTTGHIYPVAGTGTAGLSGGGGLATKAELNHPQDVAVDGAGNLVIADTSNNEVRVVAAKTGTFYGRSMTADHIYDVAGTGTAGFSGTGGPATSAKLGGPGGVALDGAGNLVISDPGGQRVQVVATSTGTFYGRSMTAGHIYNVAGDGVFAGDGSLAARAQFYVPQGLAVDSAGDQFVADLGNERIRMVPAKTGTFFGQPMTAGHVYTIAGTGSYGFTGDGGPATQAELNSPTGLAVDSAGNLLITDEYNSRIRVVAASTGTFYGQAMTVGDIYTVAGGLDSTADLDYPLDVAVDGAGNLVISDVGNYKIKVLAERTGEFYGQAMTAGDTYTVAGAGVGGYSGDGIPAVGAELCRASGVTVDPAGNLVIADGCNNRVRVVATSTGEFYGQAMTAGDIYTVAGDGTAGHSGDGGPGTSAELDDPDDVAVDAAGNLLITDEDGNRIQVLAETTGTFYGQAMTAGSIYTVAGTGTRGLSGNGGPATSAKIAEPTAIVPDGNSILFADTSNNRIREITG